MLLVHSGYVGSFFLLLILKAWINPTAKKITFNGRKTHGTLVLDLFYVTFFIHTMINDRLLCLFNFFLVHSEKACQNVCTTFEIYGYICLVSAIKREIKGIEKTIIISAFFFKKNAIIHCKNARFFSNC